MDFTQEQEFILLLIFVVTICLGLLIHLDDE